MDRPSIKNEEQYEALKDKGYSKQKAARIANSKNSGKRGGEASPYEEWNKKELYQRAKELNIDNRSKMNKSELIEALRE